MSGPVLNSTEIIYSSLMNLQSGPHISILPVRKLSFSEIKEIMQDYVRQGTWGELWFVFHPFQTIAISISAIFPRTQQTIWNFLEYGSFAFRFFHSIRSLSFLEHFQKLPIFKKVLGKLLKIIRVGIVGHLCPRHSKNLIQMYFGHKPQSVFL